ncbi:MAG: cyclic nucleotide-binding domain-containing protein [Thermodesulfobacteriota bacterium]
MKEIQLTADNRTVLKLIRKIEKFNEFSSRELEEFLQAGKLREYQPGEIVIREGASDCWLYFLISGTLEIRKGDHPIGMLRRCGDMFGEMGIIDGSPRSATILAHAKSLLVGFDAEVIDRKLKARDMNFCYIIYRAFAEVLAVRLRETTAKNVSLQKEADFYRQGRAQAGALVSGPQSADEGCRLMKALIVDGQEATRKILRSLLRELRFKDILEAVDGEAALKIMATHKIGLVVAEFQLPRLAGPEFFDKGREIPAMEATPFIFLLNSSEQKTAAAAMGDRPCHFLVKPYTANMLYEIVSTSLADTSRARTSFP